MLDGILGDLNSVFTVLAVNIYIDLLAQNFQLLDGRRSLQVVRYQKWLFTFSNEVFGKFCRGGGFAATLQTR